MEANNSALALAQRIAERFAALPEVMAFAVAGSLVAGTADAQSDVDGFCYSTAEIPLMERKRIAQDFADQMEMDNRFWEPGDEWVERATGTRCDIMYRHPMWMAEQLDRVLVRHEASVGYSTCFWFNVQHSVALVDGSGWYARLQQHAAIDYPEPLRRAIVAKNHPILRTTLSSYRHQIELALQRKDPVSVNHRLTALLASYFDILFAVNRLPHPGEKRLIAFAEQHCPLLPREMAAALRSALAGGARMQPEILIHIDQLVDGLDALLSAEGLRP